MDVKFSRVWAMPSSDTCSIKPIKELVERYLDENVLMSIDPFARTSRLAKITNDLDPEFDCTYNMDAIDFLKTFKDNEVDFVIYDPPFSLRQISECYKKMNKSVNMQTTQSSFWGNMKKEIARITKSGAYVVSFCWNSNGIGKTHGFELVEVLLVPHGGSHNDTICVVERKL